jgi:hypothetical protein
MDSTNHVHVVKPAITQLHRAHIKGDTCLGGLIGGGRLRGETLQCERLNQAVDQ